jgi:two-component system sensor histidine kinase UhpB
VAAHVEVQASLPRGDAALESACFRVVQEALTNVQRHAAARNVWVSLREEHAALVLTVRDDGRGFEPARTRARAGAASFAGLAGMEERVALAGGAFALDSRPLRGTTVTASFPCGARA